jgi:glycosyltransferase involved in cell wall biosynthesis
VSAWPFDLINKYAAGCFVPNKHTKEQAEKYIKIPIYHIPYWLLSKRMKSDSKVRREDIAKEGEIIIGSFQKDSEGNTERPKLSKGPDIFLKLLVELKKLYNIKVLLTGYNRNYLIKNFEREGISFVYIPKTHDINALYDISDWCFVTSRFEGGPQTVLEASYRKVKILSRDVGMASEVLHRDCLCNSIDDFIDKFKMGLNKREENYQNVIDNYLPQIGVGKFDLFFEKHINV